MRSDAQLPGKDAGARIDALDTTRSFIVQAPAGSGKTELLIQRYLKLLAQIDEPEEVLAITFTRKAAAEMLARVLGALRTARGGEEPAEAHRKLTYGLARGALQRSGARGWNLIGNPQRMRIQTLDSLNGVIARARPLSSPGGNSGARIVRDAGLKAVHEAAAIATLDWLAEEGAPADAVRTVLTHVDNDTRSYVAYLAGMLGTRDQWLPFIGSGVVSDEESAELRDRFEGSLGFAVHEHLKRLARRAAAGGYEALPGLFGHAADRLAESGNADSPILALGGLDAWPGTDPVDVERWAGLAELLMVRNAARFRKSVNKSQGFPTTDREQKETVNGILAAMADDAELAALLHGARVLPPVSYTDEQWSVLLALFRLLPLAVSELKRLFGEQGMTDDVEVALDARDALGSAQEPGDIALLLDYTLQHILVDEMQDTSSAQYRMLEALTGGWTQGDGRTLFCVGDPMQSIYRFRNAEVGQFLLARDFGIGRMQLESLVLRRNFRSGQGLVDWFNGVFPAVLSPESDPLRGAVSYAPAVPAPHLSGIGEVAVHPVFGADPQHEANVGCCEVRNILADNPDGELAILVRGRTQLPDLLAALRNAGIAYTAVEIDKLTDLPEIIDVLALTRAAVHAGDRIAWLGLLRAPWIGLTWADLHALVHSDSTSTVRELLQDPQRIGALSSGGRAALEAAGPALERLCEVRRSASLRQRVEECWFELGGPGALRDAAEADNVYRYFDLLESQEVGGSLRDVAKLESILEDEKVSGAARSRVQVMTMHRAKGLEFDHVMLYGLGRMPGSGGGSVLSWFDIPSGHGGERKIISPIGARAVVERDPVHRYIAAVAAEKDAHELGRLLYVACTRARKTLHLVGNVSLSRDGEEFRPARSDSLLYRLWPAVEAAYEKAFDDWAGDGGPVDETTYIEPVRQCFAKAWSLPDVAAIAGPGDSPEPFPGADEVEFYWVGAEARIAGTLAHRWLELLVSAGGESADAGERRRITLRWLRETGIANASADRIAERVERAVEGTLADARGRWLLSGPGHAELGLSGIHDGTVTSIVLDRVRIDDDGTHWIVDYKTSTHEGGNLEGFLDAEIARYTPQLRQYAELYGAWSGVSPRCALYFPLLQAFVEV
ncbi:MAG: UvrD-helicase domain-containing protein [Proteobacteria bacterium]|nr:UvrD-helicase domain-containing protein [Pseudomonadota bacterium]